MDKKSWIAVSLSVIGLVLWNFYVAQHPPPPRPAQSPAVAAPTAVIEPVRREPVGDTKTADQPPPAAPVAEQFETLSLPQMTVRFTNLGGGIADITLLGRQHLAENGQPVKLNASSRIPIGALSDAQRPGEHANEPYEMRREGDRAVVFERSTPEGLRVTKRFTVQPAPDGKSIPTLDLELTVANPNSALFRADGPYLHAGSAAPIHRADAPDFTEFAFWRDGRLKTESTRAFDAGHVPLLGIQTSAARPVIAEPVDHLAWVGLKNQFYTTIVTPAAPVGKEAAARAVWARRFDIPPPAVPAEGQNGATVQGIDAALGLPALDLAPGASSTQHFQIYAGPTLYNRLTELGRDQEEILNYGKFTKPISVGLLQTMNWLKSWLGNYFLAIIALTFIVKLITLYPQLKTMESGRRMAALGPKMTELREKYKDDPARAQQETMKLYREYGVNPLGGCLPALIQMPIFFGFFHMLGHAAELRNSGFLWVHDLSQPDTVARFMGFPVNILPLLYAGTMLWQMSLTPKPADPQQAQQQKMMMFIPLVFVFFFYNFAAALSLYYTMQNLLMIVQLYLTRNRPIPVLVRKDPDSRGGGGGGLGGLLAKLGNAAGKDAADNGRAVTPAAGGKAGRNGSGGGNPPKGKNGARRVRI